MDETCRCCEDPDYGPEEHLDWLIDTIETFGWAIQWIEPDGPRGQDRRPRDPEPLDAQRQPPEGREQGE